LFFETQVIVNAGSLVRNDGVFGPLLGESHQKFAYLLMVT